MSLEKCLKLCDYYTKTVNSKMNWVWDDGLLGYALADLNEYLKEDRYLGFLRNYCAVWTKNNPVIDSTTSCIPGLITYYVYKKVNNQDCRKLTNKIINYLKNEPLTKEGFITHFTQQHRHSKSIWIEDLVTLGFFTSLYGQENNDNDLIELAQNQTILFGKYLVDEQDCLWHHAYNLDKAYHYPKKSIYWSVCNGLAIATLPKIIDNVKDAYAKEEIKKVLKTSVDAIIKTQNNNGSFSILLTKSKWNKDTCGTAFISEGLFHAIRKGYLDKSYLSYALKAYEYCDSKIKEKDEKVFLEGISNHTLPFKLFPSLSYILAGKKSNLSYGVAAYIWASIEKELYDNNL